MTTKERLLKQIEQLDEAELETLFALVQQFLEGKASGSGDDFLLRLGDILIDGPEDFSENLDLYLRGEKSIDANLH